MEKGANVVESLEYQALLHRPRGPRMVIGVVLRVLVAVGCLVGAVLLAALAVVQLGYATGLTGHDGRFHTTACHDEIATNIQKYLDTECVGALRTPGGRLVDGNVTLKLQHSAHAGQVLAVRYTGSGSLTQTGTRQTLQAVSLSFFTLAVVSVGLVLLVHAFRHLRPTHPWCRPDSRQWRWFVRAGFLGVLGCALLGLLCWIISFGFH